MSGKRMDHDGAPSWVALTGGVGGAKLCLGLSRLVGGNDLAIIANCGDDFEHFGLHVSPDIDTVMYTLAGISNPEHGWGRADETWAFMTAMEQLGGDTWFRLGDKDLATNVERTRRRQAGEPLSAITARLCAALGVTTTILPATDDRLRTMLETDAGYLDFQTYLIRQAARPAVSRIVFDGADTARPAPGVIAALTSPALRGVIVCPSNPFVSIDPILAVAEIADVLARRRVPVIAVSPIVEGRAVKGPAAKMFRELGMQPSALEVARHYGGLIDGFVLDQRDADLAGGIDDLGVQTATAETIMTDLDSKIDLARTVLDLAGQCRAGGIAGTAADGRTRACG